MKIDKEITSTDKLLNAIRAKHGENSTDKKSAYLETSANTDPHKKKKSRISLGVVIRSKMLVLILLDRFSKSEFEIIDFAFYKFDSGMTRQSKDFPVFLSQKIAETCGGQTKIDIWTNISMANVNIKCIKIPKVSDAQIANTVYWTYKKEVSFDEKKDIFDYEIIGKTVQNGEKKNSVMVYTAPAVEVKELNSLFNLTGYPLSGITVIPFAFQNFFRTGAVQTGDVVCTVFVSNNYSRIDIFDKNNIVLSREVKTGITSMVELITREMSGSNLSELQAFEMEKDSKNIEESSQTVYAQKVLNSFLNNSLDSEKADNESILNHDKVFPIIKPVLQRLVKQVERTLEYYSVNSGGIGVSQIFVSGGLSGYTHFLSMIEEHVRLPVKVLGNSFQFPDDELSVIWQDLFVPAIGIALSANSYTPNLNYTYKEKEKELKGKQTNKYIFTGFITIIAFLSLFLLMQYSAIDDKVQKKSLIEKRFREFNPKIDQNFILQLVAKSEKIRERYEKYADNYLNMALIQQISALTPSNIRLISCITNAAGKNKDNILIEGLVVNRKKQQDLALAVYLVKLESSPLIKEIKVNFKTAEKINGKELLYFKAELEII